MIMKKRNWQYNVRGNVKKSDSFLLHLARKRTGLRPKKKGKRDEKHRKCRIYPTPGLNPTPYPSPEILNVQRGFHGWV